MSQEPTLPPNPPGHPPSYAPAAATATNGLAIASLVLGILWIYWVGSVLALVFGYVARHQIRRRNERGRGIALAGILLGWLGMVTLAVFIVLAVTFGNARDF